MADNIDALQIEISANANTAEKSLGRLADSLTRLSNSLNGITGSQFMNLSSGIGNLSNSMERFSAVVKTADFTRIATGLNKLSGIDVQGVSNASRSINTLAANLSQIGMISFDSQAIANIANSIGKLGGKTVTQAAANVPLLTVSLENLVSGLNQIGAVSFDFDSLSKLTAAISKLGGKSATAAASGNITKLADALKQMMITLSTAPKISSNIIQMTQALAQLAAVGGRAGTTATSLNRSFNLLPASTTKASKSMFSLAAAFGKFYASYWLIIRALGQFKKAIDISSDLTEVQNVVDVTFGSMSETMNEFADSALKNYGMSELMAKKIASRFQAMGVAMGFTQGKMTEMSIELTKLAGDMASFYNVSQDQIATSLQSIFTGETEPLRKFGLDLSFATVEAWALAQGLDADMQSMTQAQKTMLRYQYVMANTGAAQGDFLRTMNSWHNQLVLLSGAFQQLGSIIGGTLINAFKPFIQALNSVMAAVIQFAQTVSDALGAIFGWEYQTGGGVAQDLELGAGAAQDIEDATGGAAENAKELNKYIAGWHEVNNMTSSEGSGGGGGGGGAGGGGTGAASGGEWIQAESLWEKYTSSIDTLYALGEYIGNVLTSAMNDIDWDSVYQSARNFGTGLASFLNGLISPELFGAVGTTIAGALNTAIYAALSFGQEFDWTDYGMSIATGINNFFSTFDFSALAETINVWVQGLWNTMRTALTNIEWTTVLSGLWDFLSNIEIETIGIIIGVVTIKKIGGFVFGGALLKELAATFGIKLAAELGTAPVITTLRAGIQALFGKAAAKSALVFMFPKTAAVVSAVGTFFSATLLPAITSALSALASALGVSVAAAGGIVIGAIAAVVAGIVYTVTHWDEVKEFWTVKVPGFFTGTVIPFFQSIPSKIGEVWTNLTTSASQKWDEFIAYFSGIPDRIGGILTSIGEWFNQLPGQIGYALGYALGYVTSWASDVYETLKEEIPKTIEDVIQWFSELPEKAYNAISGFVSFVIQWGSETYNSFKEKVTEIISNVVQWFSELPGKIYDTIIKIKDKIKEWSTNTISFFREEIPKIVDKVIEFFNDLPKKIVTVGEDIIKGLWNGINNMVNWLGTKIGDFCNGVIDGFKAGFDEHSPSKEAYKIGDYFTLGLSNGITERFKDVYKQVSDFGDSLTGIRFEMPVVDMSVDTSGLDPKTMDFGTAKLTKEMDFSFDSSGFMDYNLLGQAVYQAQSQAMKENPVQIGDQEVFKAAQRGQRREYQRTFKTGWAGVD